MSKDQSFKAALIKATAYLQFHLQEHVSNIFRVLYILNGITTVYFLAATLLPEQAKATHVTASSITSTNPNLSALLLLT